MTRTRRSVWTFAGGLITTATTVGVAIVSTPLLLGWLGDERLGAFRAVTDWLGFLSLLELGIFGASQAFMAGALGRGNWTQIAAALHAGVRIYARITAVMLVVGAGFAMASPRLIRVNPELVGELRLAFALGLSGFLLLPLNLFRALVEANQRGYLVHGLLLLQSLLITGFSLLLAWYKAGLPGQAVAVLLGNLPFPLLLLWNSRRRHPELRIVSLTPEDRREAGDALQRLNWPTLLFHICGRVSLFTDTLLVSGLMGPAAVVPFIYTQRMASLLGGQVAAVGSATWAALGELYVQGRHTLFQRRFTELTRLIAVLGAAVLVPAAVLTEAFVGLWVGPHRYGGDAVAGLAAINAWLLGIVSLWGWIFHATGRVAILLPTLVVGTVANCLISLLGTLYLGIAGPLVGTVIYLIFLLLFWLPLLRRHFDIPLRPVVMAVLGPFALAAGDVLLLLLFNARYPVSGWIDLIARLTAAPAGFLALAWLVLLPRSEGDEWQGRIRGLWPGQSKVA